MAEVKVRNVRTGPIDGETPTQALVKANLQHVEVEDARGRKFVVKRLSEVEKMILARKIGSDAGNAVYFSFAMAAASVASINGEPEAPIQNARMAEALVAQLDSDGLEAVSAALEQLNGSAAAKKDMEFAKN